MKELLKVLNQKGMSIVQVLIAAGMTGGLALVITQLNQQQVKVRKTAELNTDLTMIESRIQGVINKKEVCTNTFAEAKPGTYLMGIKLTEQGDQWFIKAGQTFTGTNIIVTDLKVLTRDEEEQYGRWENSSGAPLWDEENGQSQVYLKVDFAIGRKAEDGTIIKDKSTYKANTFHKIFSIPVIIADLMPQYGCKDPDTYTVTDAMDKCREIVGTGEYQDKNYGTDNQPASSNWKDEDAIQDVPVVPECGPGPGAHMFFCEVRHVDGQIKECYL